MAEADPRSRSGKAAGVAARATWWPHPRMAVAHPYLLAAPVPGAYKIGSARPAGNGVKKMKSILYRSISRLEAGSEAEDRLVADAAAFNRAVGITGFLHREDDVYYQWIEGPEPAIDWLIARIEADSRHDHVEILFNHPATARQFEDWSMGYAGSDAPNLFDWASAKEISLKLIQPLSLLDFLRAQAAFLAARPDPC